MVSCQGVHSGLLVFVGEFRSFEIFMQIDSFAKPGNVKIDHISVT